MVMSNKDTWGMEEEDADDVLVAVGSTDSVMLVLVPLLPTSPDACAATARAATRHWTTTTSKAANDTIEAVRPRRAMVRNCATPNMPTDAKAPAVGKHRDSPDAATTA